LAEAAKRSHKAKQRKSHNFKAETTNLIVFSTSWGPGSKKAGQGEIPEVPIQGKAA